MYFQGANHIRAILSQLSGRQTANACKLSQQHRDHRLGLLIAQSEGSNLCRQLLAEQLANWYEQKVRNILVSFSIIMIMKIVYSLLPKLVAVEF